LENPIELFNALDKSASAVKELRKAQKEVMGKYFADLQTTQRISIKLPTGSGKSLIAILILESWRKAGKVVGILTANKGLAEDFKRRCDEISIPSATIFGADGPPQYRIDRTRNLRRYKLGKIIGIFNYHSFLYGTEYNQEIFPPDVLVIDDASDFETVRNDYFSIRINRSNHEEIYSEILKVLLENSHLYPNAQDFASRTARQSDVELVFFTHASLIWSVLRSHIQNLVDDKNFILAYNRNRDYEHSFLIFISEDEIEFRPLIIPEGSLKMGSIGQTIFMSATVPEEELLHKIFGIKSEIYKIDEDMLSKEAYDEIATMGKRLIFPLYGAELEGGGAGKRIIWDLYELHKKVLVLANSNFEAQSIQKFLLSKSVPTMIYRNSDDAQHFAYNMKTGVLVCANRYFGLDFPGETCKVAVVIKLPAIWDSVDAFQFTILDNELYKEQRIGYRLTQSLGRCNRLLTDEALYYIFDPRILSRFTGAEQYLRYLPRNMYGELLTGYYLSEGGLIEPALEYGKNSFFGKKDAKYDEYLAEEIENWNLQKLKKVNSKYDLEIEAWKNALISAFSASAQLFDYVGDYYKEKIDAENLNFASLAAFNYYLSGMNYYNAYAQYNDIRDKKRSMDELKKAIEVGSNRSWFNRLKAVFNSLVDDEAEKLPVDFVRLDSRRMKEQIVLEYDDFLNRNTSKNRNWKDVFDQNIKSITQGTHGEMLVGLEQIFQLMGYKVARGDNSRGEPDLIVRSPSLVDRHQISIEIKTREKGNEIVSADVTETMGDAAVMGKRLPDNKTYAVLITQKEEVVPKAIEIAKMELRIFRTSILSFLLDQIRAKIENWEKLSASERTTFIDKVVSPHEFENLMEPTDEPIISLDEIRKMIH
jgi:hypothetical protein